MSFIYANLVGYWIHIMVSKKEQ